MSPIATEFAMYYPQVVPPTSWIKQSLLYWDGAASIVPRDFWDDPHPDIEWLAKNGLYETVQIDHLEDTSAQSAMIEEFLKVIQGFDDIELERKPGRGPHESLVYGKLPRLVESMLAERGVVDDRGTQFAIHPDLLAPLICICAKHACLQSTYADRIYSLHTHSERALKTCLSPIDDDFETAITVTAASLLPLPGDRTSLQEIIEFREDNRESLTLLRAALTQNVGDALGRGEPLDRLVTRLQDEVHAERQRLARAMRERNWTVAATTVAVTLAVGVEVPDSLPNLDWLLDGIGTAALGWALTRVRKAPQPQYSYLHLAGSLSR